MRSVAAQELAAEVEQAGYEVFWDEVLPDEMFHVWRRPVGAQIRFWSEERGGGLMNVRTERLDWLYDLSALRRHLGIESA